MAQKLGYWVDLSTIALDETNDPVWIQAMTLGSFDHPVYGKIELTQDRINQFADNVAKRVRGQDLDIDYDHKAMTGEAAGWVTEAKAEPGRLMLAVQFTKAARDKIKEKAYRYFSPEFHDEWKNPKTGAVVKNVLFGGALTNRPFLKDMAPINASEMFPGVSYDDGGVSMDEATRKRLAKALNLSEDATEADIEAAEAKAAEQGQGTGDAGGGPSSGSGGEQQLSEQPDPSLVKLAETNPAVKLLLDEREANTKRLAALETKQRVSDATITLSEITGNDKQVTLTPAGKELATKLLTEPKAEDFKEFLKKLNEGTATVKLGEVGQTGASDDQRSAEEEEASKKFTDAVLDKINEAKKVGGSLAYEDAVGMVASESPELYANYRSAVSNRG